MPLIEEAAREFDAHRGLLFGVAYRVLGSVADAEDVVQEAWPRWSAAGQREHIDDPRGFLVTVVTRLAIDRLRRIKARRETYVGPWLPEPLMLVGDPPGGDAADEVTRAESVSMALLVVLETLSPLERPVFVLREVFDYPYPQIAEILDRGEPAVRQLARRAREHVAQRRHRFDSDRATREQVLARFVAACERGDLAGLLELLAPDVTLVSDSGGKARAPRRPVLGAHNVARFSLAVWRDYAADWTMVRGTVGVDPAIAATAGGVADTVVVLEVADGRITTMYLMANPDKLSHIRAAQPPR